MNKNILLLIVCYGFFSTTGFAQENKPNGDNSDKKNADPEYSYNPNARYAKAKSEEMPQQANVVKLGLTRWVDGVIPLYYERRVAKFISLQFGLGLTTRDFVADGITDLASLFGTYSANDYNNTAFYTRAGREASVGIYASFQPKFYPNRRSPTAFFLSPMVEFKRFDYKAQYANPIGTGSDEPLFESSYMWEYRNCVDFTVNIGRQWFTPSGISLEVMGGAGFQKIWEYRRNLQENSTGYSNALWVNGTTFSSYYRPEFNLDFNIGGCF